MPEQYEADYERVAREVTDRIRDGVYPPGSRLPSITQLAAEYQVSIGTVKNAQILLRERRLVRGHPGKGVFIADPLPPAAP